MRDSVVLFVFVAWCASGVVMQCGLCEEVCNSVCSSVFCVCVGLCELDSVEVFWCGVSARVCVLIDVRVSVCLVVCGVSMCAGVESSVGVSCSRVAVCSVNVSVQGACSHRMREHIVCKPF